MYCEKCGTEITEDQSVCSSCGCAVNTAQAVALPGKKGKASVVMIVVFFIGAVAFALGYVTSNSAANAAYDAAEAALRSAESSKNVADSYGVSLEDKIYYLERAKNSAASAVNYKLSAYEQEKTAKNYSYLCAADVVCLLVAVAVHSRSGNVGAADVKNK